MEKMLISKELYGIVLKSGILVDFENEMSQEMKLQCIDKFTKLILRRCVEVIDSQYIKGDLSERANGIRMARNAIIKNFE